MSKISTFCKLTLRNSSDGFMYSSSKNDERKFIQTKKYSYSDFDIKSESINLSTIKSTLGRLWKYSSLKHLYPIVHTLMYTIPNDYIVERPFQCSSKKQWLNNISDLGKNALAKYIKNVLIPLGILKCTSKLYYRFDRDAKARLYIVNKVIVKKIYRILESVHGKFIPSKKQIENIDEYSKFIKYVGKTPFGKNKRIPVKSKNIEELITKAIRERHPIVNYYMDFREILNKNLMDVCKGVYKPTYHRSRSKQFITGIGIRDNNYFCNLKAHDGKRYIIDKYGDLIEDVVINEEERKNPDYMLNRFEHQALSIMKWNKIYQYDVKSSVPRVLFLLKWGRWLDESEDLYKMVYPYKNRYEREAIKSIVMKMIFSKSFRYYWSKNKSIYRDYVYMKRNDERGIYDILHDIWEKVQYLFGPVNGTEVFLHESNIYMEVEYELQRRNISYIKKYDAFYSNDSSILTILKDIVKECANRYYKTWIDPIKQNEIIVMEKDYEQSMSSYNDQILSEFLNPGIQIDKIDNSDSFEMDDDNDSDLNKNGKRIFYSMDELII